MPRLKHTQRRGDSWHPLLESVELWFPNDWANWIMTEYLTTEMLLPLLDYCCPFTGYGFMDCKCSYPLRIESVALSSVDGIPGREGRNHCGRKKLKGDK